MCKIHGEGLKSPCQNYSHGCALQRRSSRLNASCWITSVISLQGSRPPYIEFKTARLRVKGCQRDPYSPALCSCSAPPWSCRAGFAGPRRSGSYLPCRDATAARLCPSTPLRNVLTPGGGWASGLSESASRRLTGCRTGGTPGGPTRATAQRQGPPLRVSDGPAGGASQCSSGTLRSRPPAPARSAGSAAGRTGTPLCLEGKKREEQRDEAANAPQGHSPVSEICPDTLIPWELCESLLRLWNSEAAITTRLRIQVSVFHKISILQGKLWHGARGRGCYKQVKGAQRLRCRTVTGPWFVSYARMLLLCWRDPPGLRFLLKASTSTSHWPLDSCQQRREDSVIHLTLSLSGVTPHRKNYTGNLSWPIHLHSCWGKVWRTFQLLEESLNLVKNCSIIPILLLWIL